MPVLTLGAMGFRTCLAIAAVSAAAVSLNAGANPTVNFNIAVVGGGGGGGNFNQIGAVTGTPGVFNFVNAPGGLQGPGNNWQIEWNFNADDDPSPTGGNGARLGAGFVIHNFLPDDPNPANNHIQFSIMITMAVQPGVPPASYVGTGGQTLNANGSGMNGTLATNNSAMWNYMINGGDVASLFASPYSLTAASAGTNSDSSMLTAAQTAPLANILPNSLGIRLVFDLSPGDTASFNGVFGFIPGPGSLLILAAAGFMKRSRRRA